MSTNMAENMEEEIYFLTKEQLQLDTEDDYQYEEVPIDDDLVTPGLEEDLEHAVGTIQDNAFDAQAAERRESLPKAAVTQRPEVVDDFVRNFLVRTGMERTLDCFQTEWYELQQTGDLRQSIVAVVPDVYTQNNNLEQELDTTRRELEKFRSAANKAKDMYIKLRKERDFHRMHHRRVVQEKNKLLTDFKRLKTHCSTYEPTLRQLKEKYESAMKEKMLTKLERDRAVGQVTGLKKTLKNVEQFRTNSAKNASQTGDLVPVQQGSAVIMVDGQGRGPSQRLLAEEREDTGEPSPPPRYANDSQFPLDTGVNPYLSQIKGLPGHLTRAGGFRLSNTFRAHSASVSGLSLHPRKNILVTTSDDHTWKMWSVPSGDIIMTGQGHSNWVSACDFHPTGSRLATVSGDNTVKIWDFSKAECVHTFTEHSFPVWDCSWHSCGNFLASCSMDKTCKVWDLGSLRCRYTLRGHADSVNSVEYLPFSNTLLTSSADKTISLWDSRTGLCAQTFYGHMHAVNDATFNMKGDTVASCDVFGVVKLWDLRTGAPMTSLDCGPHATEKVSFDSSGAVLAICSNDATIRMYEVSNSQTVSLVGHEDAVQCALFDRAGEFLVSGGNDCTVRIWS